MADTPSSDEDANSRLSLSVSEIFLLPTTRHDLHRLMKLIVAQLVCAV